MSLTSNQKKYIRKSITDLSIDKIAKAINVHKNTVQDFLISENYLENNLKKIEINNEEKYSNEEAIFLSKSMVFAILIVLIFVCYLWTLGFKFVSDDIYILKVKNLGSIKVIFDQPQIFLASLHYFVVNKLVGASPWLYRLSNIFFHGGNTYLIYLIVATISFPFVAFFLSLIFAIHPILIESITWVTGGSYTRYTFFLLGALFFYIKKNKKKHYYWYSVLFSIMAISSSEKAIIIPLLFLLYEISFGKIKENWKKLIPYFGITGIWVLFYLSQIGNRISGMEMQSYGQVKTLNPFFQIPVALASYIQLIFWPDKLTLYHSEMVFTPLQFGFMVLITLSLFASIGTSYFKNKQIFFWLSFFVISLLPTLTPFGISWIVAERYVYLGSIGIFFVISYSLVYLVKNEKTKIIGYLLFVICLLGLMTRTIIRNMDWRNEDTLWTSMIRTSPSDPKTHNNLGDMYGRQGNMQKSMEEFKRAIEINPNYADAYHNLGNVYINTKKYELAMKSYQKAASINPNLWQSYQNIAAIYFSAKQYDKALENMDRAIKINPNESGLYMNLAVIYLQMGNKVKAKVVVLKALEIEPNNEKAKKILMSL